MRSTPRRIACTALVAVAVSTLVVAGICDVEIAGGAHGWDVGLGFAVAGSVLMTADWPVRFLRAWRACRAPAESRHAVPMLGVSNAVRSPYLVLVAPHHPLPGEPGFRYERGLAELARFLWDPALRTLGRGDVVLLHRHRRTGVVDLPDGIRLWPAGRLRVRPPRGCTPAERPPTRDEPRADPVARIPLGYVTLAVVVTGVATLAAFGLMVAVAVAVYTAGLAVHTWAWYGAEP